MATRRMISSKIIGSARFLKMPASSQNLYFHLILSADDDGIVEGFTIMRLIGSTEDDLKILSAKGFVEVLNDDLVTYINDWLEHNKIRADRKVDSIYQDLLIKVLPEADIRKPKKATGRQLSDNCQTNDRQMTDKCQHRLGKDRLGKDRLGKDSKDILKVENDNSGQCPTDVAQSIEYRVKSIDNKDKEPPKKSKNKNSKHKYGEYDNVLLSDDELTKLKDEFPTDWEDRIERVSEYVATSGKKYKNFLAVIRNWAKKEKATKPQLSGVIDNSEIPDEWRY